MTDMMINSDLAPGTAASTPVTTAAPTASGPTAAPVPVTSVVADRPEVGSSWGLLLVPILICVVLALYVSLI